MLKGLKYETPKWFDAEVKKFTEDYKSTNEGFDHLRTYKGKVVISQPYLIEKLSTLRKLQEAGINVKVLGFSPYFPGSALSIVIWRDEDQDLALEVLAILRESEPSEPLDKTIHAQWI